MDLGPTTFDDPHIKTAILGAIREGEDLPFTSELDQALSTNWRGFESSTKPLAALQSMLRHEDVPRLLEHSQGPPLKAFRALWHSGLFRKARELAQDSELGIGVPSTPTSTVRSAGPHIYTQPQEEGFADAETLSEWGIWGISAEALRLMRDVLIRGSLPWVLRSNILLTGPEGTDKLNVARALHALRKRGHFEILDCRCIESDPSELIQACVAGGTVFLRGLELVPAQWGAAVYEAVAPTHKLRGKEASIREDEAIHIADTLFIVDVSNRYAHGVAGALCRQGHWDEVGMPPLSQRTADIPLLVNQALLRHGVPSPIDESRHRFAVALWEFYEEHEPPGDSAWLESEIKRWLGFLAPATLPAQSDPVSESTDTLMDEQSECVFRHADNRWEFVFEGMRRDVAVALDGFRYIRYLLKTGGWEGGVSATDVRACKISREVAGYEDEATRQTDRAISEGKMQSDRTQVARHITGMVPDDPEDDSSLSEGELDEGDNDGKRVDRGEITDPQTVNVVTKGIADIEEELRIEEMDREKREQLEEKRIQLKRYLSESTGLGGHPRKFSEQQKKDRDAVRNAIGRAKKLLDMHHPILAGHIHSYVHYSGGTWHYTPPKPLDWHT